MQRPKIRLTIDACLNNKLERDKLTELQMFLIDQIEQWGLCEYFKVTLEYNDVQSSEKESANAKELTVAEETQVWSGLSDRQRQIADLLCRHYSIRRIAEELYVSENTVKKHIQNMKRALDINCSGADFIYVLQEKLQRGEIA
jgi:DNA-binding NarL/FixJ family response regulator